MNPNSNCAVQVQQPIKYKTMIVKKYAIIGAVLGIILYFADIFSDLSLAVNYYYDGHLKFFGLTLLFVVLSAIVSSIFSLYMYWADDKKEDLKVSDKNWILRIIFLISGIAPVLRNIDSLRFAWKSYHNKDKTEKQNYARRMIFEIADSSFLRLFEAFFESGPQLVLQVYIFVELQALDPNIYTKTKIWQVCTMLISVISISGSIVSYFNSLRNSMEDKNELKWYLLPLLFLWRIFEIISRVIPLGLGISATPYIFGTFVVHFIVMTVWTCFMKINFCDNRYAENLYKVLVGVILTFVYFNPEESPIKKRCMLFYVGMFVENTFLMAFWFHQHSHSTDLILRLPAIIIQISSFCLSIVFMVIYYKFFHPTIGILCKRRYQESNNCSETGMQNAETNAVLEMVQSNNCSEIGMQNAEANAVLEMVQSNNCSETGMQNAETNAVLEMVQSNNCSEIGMQNAETNAVLEMVQSNNCSEIGMQNAETNAVLEMVQSNNCSETGMQNAETNAVLEMVQSNNCSEIGMQNVETKAVLEMLQSNNCSKTGMQNAETNGVLEMLQNNKAIET